ncbi:MAG: Clostridium epsilon toxin ETX/ mosquitocidal toxin [Pseudomonadota bacterium]
MKKQNFGISLVLLYGTAMASTIIPDTYITDETLKNVIIRSIDLKQYDTVCKGYPDTIYTNVKIVKFNNTFDNYRPIGVQINEKNIITQHAGHNEFINNTNTTQEPTSASVKITHTDSTMTTTTHGWKTSVEVSGGDAGKRFLPLPGIKLTAEYNGSIAKAVQKTQATEYSTPGEKITVLPHHRAIVDTEFNVLKMKGEYAFTAISTGTALISYTAKCKGEVYHSISEGKIASFLYYRNPSIPLPKGLTFEKNESGVEELHLVGGGIINSTDLGTDFTVTISSAPMESKNLHSIAKVYSLKAKTFSKPIESNTNIKTNFLN